MPTNRCDFVDKHTSDNIKWATNMIKLHINSHNRQIDDVAAENGWFISVHCTWKQVWQSSGGPCPQPPPTEDLFHTSISKKTKSQNSPNSCCKAPRYSKKLTKMKKSPQQKELSMQLLQFIYFYHSVTVRCTCERKCTKNEFMCNTRFCHTMCGTQRKCQRIFEDRRISDNWNRKPLVWPYVNTIIHFFFVHINAWLLSVWSTFWVAV